MFFVALVWKKFFLLDFKSILIYIVDNAPMNILLIKLEMHPIKCLIMQSPIVCKKTEKGQKVKDTGASQS